MTSQDGERPIQLVVTRAYHSCELFKFAVGYARFAGALSAQIPNPLHEQSAIELQRKRDNGWESLEMIQLVLALYLRSFLYKYALTCMWIY